MNSNQTAVISGLTLAAMLLLSGCASNTLGAYFHKANGQSGKDNPAFARDITACKKMIYADGVLVEGVRIYDQAIIEKYEDEYARWVASSVTTPKAGERAEAGLPAAAKPVAGVSKNIKPGSELKVPEKYSDLERLRKAQSQCMNLKGWKE